MPASCPSGPKHSSTSIASFSGERKKKERMEGKGEKEGGGRRKEEGRLAVNLRLGRDGRRRQRARDIRAAILHAPVMHGRIKSIVCQKFKSFGLPLVIFSLCF